MAKIKFRPFLMIIIVVVVFAMWLLYIVASLFMRLDLSQDYRKITGIENVVFQHNGWNDQYYKRCLWGLSRTEVPDVFEEYKTSTSTLARTKLHSMLDTDNYIRQAVFSPDENYILYCEIEYDYKKTGVTDDEYCYYRVYEMKSGEVITIYHAYREWYNLDWLN